MPHISDIETPAVVVDMAIVRTNLQTMAQAVAGAGCALRPHVKTHKIPELARLQMSYGACGISCAKVSEAEIMADGGLNDIFIAYPLVGDFRIRRAAALAQRVRLILAVDSLAGAQALSQAAQREGLRFEVRLEVDTGLNRTGAAYDAALALAPAVATLPGLDLRGVFTFRGLMLDGAPTADRRAAGLQEGQMLASLADRLRGLGLNIRDVSCGSTPTGAYAAQAAGVTEVRPGTYIFYDRMQVREGACRAADCAAAVWTTVVSTPREDLAIVDGGSKTFATDFIPGVPPFFFEGYGVAQGNDDLVLERVNEEHGMLRSRGGHTGLAVGQRVAIVPTHICTTVNLHDRLWLMENGLLRSVAVAARGRLV